MKKLIASSQISNKLDWLVLNCIHELRIVSVEQLYELISLDLDYSLSGLYYIVNKLKKDKLIESIKFNHTNCYYLTKIGHQSIGGLYTLPKVPEYNLAHHLAVTDFLIQSLKQVNDMEEFIQAISERRQVYEKKDMSQNKKGNSYHVADFILQFTKDDRLVNWHVEIELTLKSKRRYINGIFPKYIKMLNKNPRTQLLYVTPNKLIENELSTFKLYFQQQKNNSEFKDIPSNVFERLHVIPSEQFDNELEQIINKTFREKEKI